LVQGDRKGAPGNEKGGQDIIIVEKSIGLIVSSACPIR
jgi:hypothetical protein